MLASLSSFLPSVLTPNQNKPAQQQPTQLDVSDAAGNETDDAKSIKDTSPKKRDKKDKSAAETFVFVRPPPSKSNHPLNLQVQMVPPRPRQGSVSSYRQPSFDAPATPTPSYPDPPKSADTIAPRPRAVSQDTSSVTLARADSTESSAAYSSSTSVASFASVGSTASTRRTIIPLYNLQAHNVMTNTIVDAGTDAKIAKFNKRGIELIGLAFLEPVEVFGAPPIASRAEHSPFLGTKRLSTSSRPLTPDMPHTPASSSALSLSSASHSHAHHQQASSPTQAPPRYPYIPESPAPASRNKPLFFGKLFRKKEAAGEDTTTTTTAAAAAAAAPPSTLAPPPPPVQHDRGPSAPNPVSRVTRHFKRTSLSIVGPALTAPTTTVVQAPVDINTASSSIAFPRQNTLEAVAPVAPSSNVPAATAAMALRPPVLGIQPTFSSPVNPPVGRPSLYVWVVRRWLKGGETGILGGVIGKIGASAALAAGKVSGGGGGGHADISAVSGGTSVDVRFEWKRGRGMKRRRKGRSSVGVDDVSGPSRSRESPNSETRQRRANRASVSSMTSENGVSALVSRRDADDERDGEDSDPEDSETPWTCTLKVRRVAEGGGGDDEGVQAVRVKVGTLSQTPHHPKVVAMLKVPFPLPDVGVDRMIVRKRVAGVGWSGVEGMMLTAEEIKDVVSSTGLWLVVREGFGGVGKVTRKGDGWRIRA